MSRKVIFVAGILTAWVTAAFGQEPATPTLASSLAPARGDAHLVVTSTAFKNGGDIPDLFSQNGQNISPPLSWTAGPSGTKSYVVLVEDSGVKRPQPIFHWVLYNVPSSTTHLPQDVSKDPQPASIPGAKNGLNIRKAPGYMGPKPPAGENHPYHFEVFAIDQELNPDPAAADRNTVVAAMKGHVLAEGEIVGMYTGK
jgi:Raf kinase inhibitor-like YbhB/YbcL family protein